LQAITTLITTPGLINLDFADVMRFRDGRIVERWTTADMLGLLIQLGAMAGPAG
jgi:cell division GTPase FtsZ